MSTTQTRTQAKQRSLLGHPLPLSADDVTKCRERLAGLPISQAEARIFGASVDMLVG